MTQTTEESIATSLEVEQHLLPHMPYLLQDLWALGSSIDQIIEVCGSFNLSPDATILDLGCGKGALSIQLAARYGFRVTGIDAMAPFLEDARRKAGEYKVSHLCQFKEQDMVTFTSAAHDFDIVILASIGGVFGSFTDTIARLRTQVRAGGYIIIDDGYLKKQNSIDRNGYEHYRDHERTVQELTAFNDRLVKEINTSAGSKEINDEYLVLIGKRCSELGLQFPQLKEDFNAYMQMQEEECWVLDNECEGAIWVLQLQPE
ncbi:MAG: class I SAM-dependent methyltransferase [bacterium]|nr:class I SAM-dependent methyltransferase [bacterium]